MLSIIYTRTCLGSCAEINALLAATESTLAREVAHHGLDTGTRHSLSDAVRALKTAQEDAHRRCTTN
jgi:hypothetical protein